MLLGLAVAASSWAQGMFYQEVEKDGRIYVFANGQRYEAFEKSGGAEIGVAITRLGYGPNGETVVFDSEDAINLYNFKHDKPGEVFAKPKEHAEAGRRPSGQGRRHDLRRLHLHRTRRRSRTPTRTPSTRASFEVRRAYINVTGNVSDCGRLPDHPRRRGPPDDHGHPAFRLAAPVAGQNLDGSLIFRLKYAFWPVQPRQGHDPRHLDPHRPAADPLRRLHGGDLPLPIPGDDLHEREGLPELVATSASPAAGLPERLRRRPRSATTTATPTRRPRRTTRRPSRSAARFGRSPGWRPSRASASPRSTTTTSRSRTADRKRFIGRRDFRAQVPRTSGCDVPLDAKDRATAAHRSRGEGQRLDVLGLSPAAPSGFEASLPLRRPQAQQAAATARPGRRMKSRILGGLSYWFKVKAPLDRRRCSPTTSRSSTTRPSTSPTEKRFEIKTLFNF